MRRYWLLRLLLGTEAAWQIHIITWRKNLAAGRMVFDVDGALVGSCIDVAKYKYREDSVQVANGNKCVDVPVSLCFPAPWSAAPVLRRALNELQSSLPSDFQPSQMKGQTK